MLPEPQPLDKLAAAASDEPGHDGPQWQQPAVQTYQTKMCDVSKIRGICEVLSQASASADCQVVQLLLAAASGDARVAQPS